MCVLEVRGSVFSLEPQLRAIFDLKRAGELCEELRKLLQTVLTWQTTEESRALKARNLSVGLWGNLRPLMSWNGSVSVR